MTSTAVATRTRPEPTYQFVAKHSRGDIMIEHTIVSPDGQPTTQTVLVIHAGTRPGVWLNGKELRRKTTVYGCHSEPRLQPKYDVRSTGYHSAKC